MDGSLEVYGLEVYGLDYRVIPSLFVCPVL